MSEPGGARYADGVATRIMALTDALGNLTDLPRVAPPFEYVNMPCQANGQAQLYVHRSLIGHRPAQKQQLQAVGGAHPSVDLPRTSCARSCIADMPLD